MGCCCRLYHTPTLQIKKNKKNFKKNLVITKIIYNFA
nr:MAG TPA: hypothetical protein [Crassvirales sp.]